MAFTYQLEKHPKRKGRCPACQQDKVFRFYQDQDGNRQSEEFGRCDREAKCGYHRAPETPEGEQQINKKPPKPPIETIFPGKEIVQKLEELVKTGSSHFHQFCRRLGIDDDHLKKWEVGTEKDKTVFVHRNCDGKIVNAKWFKYSEDGKRVKEFTAYSLKQPKEELNKKYPLCLYGEHLLCKERSKKVAVVESEKTAVIASFFYPGYDWVSCAAANGLSDGTNETNDKISKLFGREVYWICDSDKAGRKNHSITNLVSYKLNHSVIDLFPERTDGYDIGDAIIDGLRPDIRPAEKQDKKKEKEKVELKDTLPGGVDVDDYVQFAFYENKGCYWSIGNNGKVYAVSNFIMKILYHVKSSDGTAYRVIEIKNQYGFKTVIHLNTDDFVSVSSFKKSVAREGNFIFHGKDVDLTRLQDKLQREEKPTSLVDPLGYNRKHGFYSFANGIYDLNTGKFKEIDEHGIIEYEKHNFYIPALSKMYEDKSTLFINERKFIYQKSEVTFQDWAKKYIQVYGTKGNFAISYYITCLFRDIIYNSINRRFPILFLYGQKGSGKGTFAQSLLRLFGHEQNQFMLAGAGTVKGFMRKFAQFSNAIVWLDEYKNNIHKFFIESLKNVYDGIGYERAKTDNTYQTESTPVLSGCILSGQEMPTIEPALFSRVVLLTFGQPKFSEKQRQNKKELDAMEDKGLSHISCVLLKHRHLFEKKFKTNFEKNFKLIAKEINNNEVDDRLLVNGAVFLTGFEVISEVEKLPITFDEFKKEVVDNTLNQFITISGSDDISKFWEIVEGLYNQGFIKENKDFQLEDGYLFIRIQNVYGLYQKEMRQRMDFNVLAKPTLENYLETNTKQFVAKKKKSFKDGSYTHTYQFKYAEVGINLIAIEDKFERERKFKEMGIEVDEEEDLFAYQGVAQQVENGSKKTYYRPF